jgi:hypothetical protein
MYQLTICVVLPGFLAIIFALFGTAYVPSDEVIMAAWVRFRFLSCRKELKMPFFLFGCLAMPKLVKPGQRKRPRTEKTQKC